MTEPTTAPTADGHGSVLPAELRALYERIAHGQHVPAESEDLARLVELGLVIENPYSREYLAVDAEQVERRLRAHAESDLARAVTRLGEVPSVVEDLRSRRPQEVAQVSASAVFLTPAEINAALSQAIDGAREELLTAQPGPRPKKLLRQSIGRDAAAVERGISMRTLYPASARTHSVTGEWAAAMTERGAQVRTLASSFMRCVVIDRETAVIQDHADNRPTSEGGYLIRDRAVASFIADAFETYWVRGEDWAGAATSEHASVTTPLQRAILRELCGGRTQQQIATSLGYTSRTVGQHLTELRTRLGFETLHQLVHWWSTSDERHSD
ncbi:LuxR C-terminal-related transcriptional regulator [Streptomyces sp. Da 82-17]|uniref:LuxR C-terminal-related transcriptional regulator n=1 Tax=Streptomyces sp. Da 82-17 TaxID=3377116 RepID=UPI0038D430F6